MGKELFNDRFRELCDEWIDQHEALREARNKEIEAANKVEKARWKNQNPGFSTRDFKPTTPPDKEKFNLDRLLDEINRQNKCSIDVRNFKGWHTGGHFPNDFNDVKAIADFFNVSFAYLCGVDDVKNREHQKIQEIFPLDDNAIETLKQLPKSFPETALLNSMLTDEETAISILHALDTAFYNTYSSSRRYREGAELAAEKENNTLSNQRILNRTYDEMLPLLLNEYGRRYELEQKLDEYQYANNGYEDFPHPSSFSLANALDEGNLQDSP